MMTPQRPPASDNPRTDVSRPHRSFMDWLFGRKPTPPHKASSNDYIGDTVDGDFSSPSAHHHHNHHRGKQN